MTPRAYGEFTCSVCGARAHWGYGVSLLHGRPGDWRCAAHRIAPRQEGGAR